MSMRAAAGEMQQRLLALRRADEPAGAARDGLVGQPDDRRAALRAARRHRERPRAARPLVRQHAHDLRDHVARAAHDHRVADAHVLAPDLVLVVQRRVGDGHAADEHRLEARHRRDARRCARPARRCRRPRSPSPRPGTCARRAQRGARVTKPSAPAARGVDLVDDAVDLEGQARAAARQPPRRSRRSSVAPRATRADRRSPECPALASASSSALVASPGRAKSRVSPMP